MKKWPPDREKCGILGVTRPDSSRNFSGLTPENTHSACRLTRILSQSLTKVAIWVRNLWQNRLIGDYRIWQAIRNKGCTKPPQYIVCNLFSRPPTSLIRHLASRPVHIIVIVLHEQLCTRSGENKEHIGLTPNFHPKSFEESSMRGPECNMLQISHVTLL